MSPAADLESLAASHDIIAVGMQADATRRRLRGTTATFVRVADLRADVDAAVAIAPAAGEVRIVGVPVSRAAAVARVAQVAAAARGIALSAFSLADLEEIAARESVTL